MTVLKGTDDLPAYSGEQTRCTKCRYLGFVGTRYVPANSYVHVHPSGEVGFHTGEDTLGDEFLVRTCLHCGYTWAEKVASPEEIQAAEVYNGVLQEAVSILEMTWDRLSKRGRMQDLPIDLRERFRRFLGSLERFEDEPADPAPEDEILARAPAVPQRPEE